MLAQKAGGGIVNITSTMVDHPIAGINSAVRDANAAISIESSWA
jgi:hypothetical protein